MGKTNVEKLEELRHAFEDGHTDGDVASVLKKVLALTGLHLAVIFKFHDMHGTSGDSDMAVVMPDGTMTEAPDLISMFLYEGLGDSAVMVKGDTHSWITGPVQFDGKKPIRMSEHVYVWELDTSKEWDDSTGFDDEEEEE